MKQRKDKQYAGVCMDNTSAKIITNGPEETNGSYAVLQTVKSHETHGGGSEHSMNNAKHTDELKYFKALALQLLPYDEILVFGSGKAQEQFQNYLKEDSQFNDKQVSIDTAEHLTDPQMIATVRDFFKAR